MMILFSVVLKMVEPADYGLKPMKGRTVNLPSFEVVSLSLCPSDEKLLWTLWKKTAS